MADEITHSLKHRKTSSLYMFQEKKKKNVIKKKNPWLEI